MFYYEDFDLPVEVNVGFITDSEGDLIVFTQVIKIEYHDDGKIVLTKVDGAKVIVSNKHSYMDVNKG